MSGRIRRPEDGQIGGGAGASSQDAGAGFRSGTRDREFGNISCQQDERSGLAMRLLQKWVCLPSSGKRETGLSDDGKTED
ncbi:hypothetical protein [Rhizobium sp. R634]|uniref:hypothetical protein n=1 Tax=Rhizobium sp. R634 TaxID=1764274 RepID=UPI001130189D|nr:hypothetical protein [Rhizobium sp. R634]